MGKPKLYRPTAEELLDDIEPHAATREYMHRFSPTNAGIEPNADKIGVIGERAVCETFGVDPERWIQSERNTKGWFLEILGLKIKSYATYNPDHIVVKAGAVNADVYVLVYIHKTGDWPSVLGWASRSQILAAPVRNVSGGAYSLPAHWHERQKNRNVNVLRAEIAAALAEGRSAVVPE